MFCKYNLMCSYLFQAIIATFYHYYTVCFDTEKQSSLEEIREWFNIKLVSYGQDPWRKHGRKWAIVQSKLSLHMATWQRRASPTTL